MSSEPTAGVATARVADYQLGEELGTGPGGIAYRCEPPTRLGLGEPCVVRVLGRRVSAGELEHIVGELAVVAALAGERLVELLEVGEHAERLFIVSRYYPQGSLASAAAAPDALRLRALADAAHAAHALHEHGIVHRAIRPASVLLAGDRGRLGVPALVELAAPGVTSTASGPLTGLAYVEPEVIWGEPAARATDIWALGASAHEVLCGRPIHPDLPDGEVAAAFQHVLHTRPVVDPAVGPAAAEVISACLAPRRADRFATAQEVAQAFERLLEASGHPAGLPPSVEGLPPDARVVALVPARPEVLEHRSPLPIEGTAGSEARLAAARGEVLVRGVRCARGHLNAPGAVTCSRCGLRVASSGSALVEGVRPPLGVLTFDDGTSAALVADVVLGREPEGDPLVATGEAVALRVADPGRTVSRSHALVRLIDWDVFLEDRSSANGTFLRPGPQHPWHRLAPDERLPLLPGAMVRLGEREVAFEQFGVG